MYFLIILVNSKQQVLSAERRIFPIKTMIKTKQTKINQHKISKIHPQITSTTPFYVDRRLRIPFIHQNRCLSPHRRQNIPHFDLNVAMSSRNGVQSRRGDESTRSCQLSPRVQNKRIALQWDILNTILFKQNLKDILKKYYEIKQLQLDEISQKIQKERIEQMQKIQKSFQILFRQNRKIYRSMKQNSNNLRYKQLINRDKLEKQDQIIQPFPSLEEFVQNVFENQGYLSEKKVDENRIQQRIEELFQNDFLKRSSYLNKQRLKKARQPKESKINSSQQNDLSSVFKTKEENSVKKSFMQNLRNYFHTNKSDLKHFSDEEKLNLIQQCANLVQNSQQQQNLKSIMDAKLNDSGEDKFYRVIKQMLVRSKIDKSIQNSRQSKLNQPKEINTGDKSSLIKGNNNVEKLAGILKNVSQRKMLKKLNSSQTLLSTTLKRVKLSQQATTKQHKNLAKTSRNSTPKKQNSLKPSLNKLQRKSKKQLKKSKQNQTKLQKSKANQQAKNQAKLGKGEKLKLKQRVHKGVNYAKFINRMLKAAQNDRSNNQPQKFKFYKKIKTRQAVISKRKYKESNLYQDEHDDENKNFKKLILTNKKSTSQHESLSSYDSDKKGKMTKYEQARLMYNMRNIKSRQLISTLPNPNNQADESQKRKRTSFCNFLPNNDSEIKYKSRRGSFSRYKDDEEEGFTSPISTRTMVRRSSKVKFSSNSSRQGPKAQLAGLQNFLDFDLRQVKENIASYLRKYMPYNDKAKQLYNFLMYMEQSRKITLEQQEISSSLDHLKLKKQLEDIKSLVYQIKPEVDDYEGLPHLFQNTKWNERDLSLANKKFFDKLDARSIEILYWNNEDQIKGTQGLLQSSLKQIKNLPV